MQLKSALLVQLLPGRFLPDVVLTGLKLSWHLFCSLKISLSNSLHMGSCQ